MSAVSEVLDPELVKDLVSMSAAYHDNQAAADDDKWEIASRVLDLWDEHKSLFATREDYYAECSRVMNIGKKRKMFSDSGETLKVWCQVKSTYSALETTVDKASEFLDLLSFDHLRTAKTLYNLEKVKSPFDALKWCLGEEGKKAVEEMRYHFNPPAIPDEYETAKTRIDSMLNKDFWKWLKPDKVKRVIELVNEIQEIIREANK